MEDGKYDNQLGNWTLVYEGNANNSESDVAGEDAAWQHSLCVARFNRALAPPPWRVIFLPYATLRVTRFHVVERQFISNKTVASALTDDHWTEGLSFLMRCAPRICNAPGVLYGARGFVVAVVDNGELFNVLWPMIVASNIAFLRLLFSGGREGLQILRRRPRRQVPVQSGGGERSQGHGEDGVLLILRRDGQHGRRVGSASQVHLWSSRRGQPR